MRKRIISRKAFKRIKQSSSLINGYKLYCKTTGLFYNGKNLDYDSVGKTYINLGDCRKAMIYQSKQVEDAQLYIVKLTYLLDDIEILEK